MLTHLCVGIQTNSLYLRMRLLRLRRCAHEAPTGLMVQITLLSPRIHHQLLLELLTQSLTVNIHHGLDHVGESCAAHGGALRRCSSSHDVLFSEQSCSPQLRASDLFTCHRLRAPNRTTRSERPGAKSPTDTALWDRHPSASHHHEPRGRRRVKGGVKHRHTLNYPLNYR